MNIKVEDNDLDDSPLKQSEWTKTSNEGRNEDSDDSDDELVYATGFPPPPPGKRLAPVGQEVDAEEVRDGKALQVSASYVRKIRYNSASQPLNWSVNFSVKLNYKVRPSPGYEFSMQSHTFSRKVSQAWEQE